MIHVSEPNPSESVDEALDLAELIVELVEELPSRAEEFGIDVAEKAVDIAKEIERMNRVTKKQIDALRNMLDGVYRWIDR